MLSDEKKLDKKNIKMFFKERAKKHEEKYPLKSVIYQDKNPSLAKERDAYEKNKIKNLINISDNDVVLDVGCGIGRWAEDLSKITKKYVGIDYVREFINIAKAKYNNQNNIHFICLDGTKLSHPEVKSHSPYTVIIIVGLYLYIDNEEGYNILKQILEISANESLIIIREPIAIEKEITLDNVWSDDMETYYSARYRTRDWFKKMFSDLLFEEGYNLIIDEALFPNHLENRKETMQHLFCLKKFIK